LYEGEKEKNGKTSAETERQAHSYNNFETDRNGQGFAVKRSGGQRYEYFKLSSLLLEKRQVKNDEQRN
jgi:hypothetical protein